MPHRKTRLLALSTSLLISVALVGGPAPAVAGGFGNALSFGLGAVVGGMMGGRLRAAPRRVAPPRAARAAKGNGGRSSKSTREAGDDSSPSAKPSKTDTARLTDSRVLLARVATGGAVFKTMVVSKGLSAVGVEEEIDSSRNDFTRETQRDYTDALSGMLNQIDTAAKRLSKVGDAALSQGDVTQHALDRAVSNAYDAVHLATFEQFLGEQWTNERLRVAILDRASTEVPGLLVGNNFRRVEIGPIEDIIQRSAKAIYKRTFETSELIAVNQATARFTRALFELHGPIDDGDIRAGVEAMLGAAARSVLAGYDETFVRSEYGIVMRYRAERVIADCLTANLEDIVGKGKTSTTQSQMVDKVGELARGECRQWVESAIGPPVSGSAAATSSIDPLPVRAVWAGAGPAKTDASMFGRVNSSF